MSSWIQDIRHSIRSLARQPGFVTVAVLSLALGMGVNTAVFSAVNAFLLRPLPVRDLDRTVIVYHSDKEHPDKGTTFPAFEHYRSRAETFSAVMAFSGARPLLFAEGNRREQVYAEIITADFFKIADIRLQLGRPMDSTVDRASDPPLVAMLSDRFWTRHLHSDPDIVGKTVVLNDRAFTVAGVASPEFTGFDPEVSSDLWIPLTAWAQLVGEPGRLGGEEHWLRTVARLKDGVSLEQAQTAVALAARAVNPPSEQEARVRWASESFVGSTTDALAIGGAAFAVGLLVLALACMNVTSLLMARAAARQKEMAVRMALGGNRWRLVRGWLIDSFLISLFAGAAGLIVAAWMIDLVVAFKPPVEIGQAQAPTLALTFDLDLRVFAFALGLSTLPALFMGLVSGLQASSPRALRHMKMDRRFAPGFNLRSLIIASQMALSLVLLIPCGLFVRSWLNASVIDPGFATDRVLLLPISADQSGVRVQKPPGFEQALIDRVAALPGVEAVTAMDPVPLWFGWNAAFYTIDGSGEQARLNYARIAPGYFDTLKIRLLRGRDFTRFDTASAPPVVIVNETMARRYWPDGNAVGAKIRRGESVMEVVGVAHDAKYATLAEDSEPFLYQPLAQEPSSNLTLSLAVRTTGDPLANRDPIQREVRALIPSWPAFQFRTLAEGLQLQQQLPRFSATLLGVLGSLGLLLASVGLYGVMTYVVGQRTHEIGIRLALGSPVIRVIALMVRQGMTVCVAGAAVGMAAAMAVSQLLTSVLYGISPADPLTLVLVPLLLIGVGLLACYLPARHAARVNPLEALRLE
jgi:macrolide transport system ATP-binding/permease protein